MIDLLSETWDEMTTVNWKYHHGTGKMTFFSSVRLHSVLCFATVESKQEEGRTTATILATFCFPLMRKHQMLHWFDLIDSFELISHAGILLEDLPLVCFHGNMRQGSVDQILVKMQF